MAISRLRQPTFYNVSVARASVYLELGGVVTEAGGYRIHTFTDVGTELLDFLSTGFLEYLIVAGGGGGGGNQSNNYARGGGGAGGMLFGSTTISSLSTTLTVGQGGIGQTTGQSGGDSSVLGFTAIGGGAGGHNPSGGNGLNGGSGGGGGGSVTSLGGSGTLGQGNNGGSGSGKTL